MDLHSTYPGVMDLKWKARKRLPAFVWEYLDSGTGTEATKARNRAALDRVGFLPAVLHGEFTPDLSTRLFGKAFPLPFGIAPVGMSGLIWPGAENTLARAAASAGIPYSLSTVASQTPEDVAPSLGDHGWFQLYPPRDEEIRRDMLNRARAAGFDTLVVTVDVPVASRRERQTRSGLTQPPRLTPRLLAQVARRPAWALAVARAGMPRMRIFDPYVSGARQNLPSTAHIGYLLRTAPDRDYIAWLRDNWQGPLVVKGVLRAEDARMLEDLGADAVWVSNHAGRQFDGAPGAIEVLADIRAATTVPLIFDSGIEGGLDILRALATGADFVMLGRAFHFAVAALGEAGPGHLVDMLARDMAANMGQLGVRRLAELPAPIQLAAAP
ncbi:alpha-hydroxy acid oxidase [Pukyongiella litopenaei]|uniref:Alpha-hydroxy-acid oxidizing protein n=1 Tax=Pukyongiella litopenaei TaxID=2605946 RepID=A0A2S0MN94_9RHOB|nr:alpha-hydroxy acid oxidase [Pukyongiella litopenaei]AVO37345.1 alpha-hydroxy-acid oxidizing protein [Pukyongiella litopenaei]